MVEMDDDPVEAVGPARAVRAAGVPLRRKHEVVYDQLAPPVKELRKRLPAVRSFEGIRFVDALPGQRPPFLAQPVAKTCELLLAGEERLAGPQPFIVRDDRVTLHACFPPARSS